MPNDSPCLFTIQEANALLQEIEPLIRQLQGLQESLIKNHQELNDTVAKISAGNGYPIKELRGKLAELTKHQLHLIEAFQSVLQQIEDLGVILKDLSIGLIDFYSEQDGETVFLCWKLGEPRIAFWHGLEEGYTGRKPL